MLDVITLHAGVLLLFIIQSENVYCEDYNRFGSSDSCSTPYFSKLFHSQCQCQLNKIKHWLFLTDNNFWVKYFRGAVFVNIFASVLQSDYQKKEKSTYLIYWNSTLVHRRADLCWIRQLSQSVPDFFSFLFRISFWNWKPKSRRQPYS